MDPLHAGLMHFCRAQLIPTSKPTPPTTGTGQAGPTACRLLGGAGHCDGLRAVRGAETGGHRPRQVSGSESWSRWFRTVLAGVGVGVGELYEGQKREDMDRAKVSVADGSNARGVGAASNAVADAGACRAPSPPAMVWRRERRPFLLASLLASAAPPPDGITPSHLAPCLTAGCAARVSQPNTLCGRQGGMSRSTLRWPPCWQVGEVAALLADGRYGRHAGSHAGRWAVWLAGLA